MSVGTSSFDLLLITGQRLSANLGCPVEQKDLATWRYTLTTTLPP